MSEGGTNGPGMALRYRRRDGTWASPEPRREPSGWWWPVPEDCDRIAEIEITAGGGGQAAGVADSSGGYDARRG